MFDRLEETVDRIKPDVFWTTWHFTPVIKEQSVLRNIRQKGVRVFMLVDWPPPRSPREADVIASGDIVDVCFGEREPESMVEFERATGKRYYLIPNAANRLLHFPTAPVVKYQYDIVFLGAKLPLKMWFFDNILLPLKRKYKVGIFGPCWTIRDNVLRVGQRLCRDVKFRAGADIFGRMRMLIPPEEENQLYSSAKISVNFHEREPDGSQPHLILNQRTFKICACGGFQICDHVPALRKYFAEDEVVMANDKDDWFKKIDYYLGHDAERETIRKQGIERALHDHSYHNRVAYAMELYRQPTSGESMPYTVCCQVGTGGHNYQ